MDYYPSTEEAKCTKCKSEINLNDCIDFLEHNEIVTKNCSHCKQPNIFRINRKSVDNSVKFAVKYSKKFKKNKKDKNMLKNKKFNVNAKMIGNVNVRFDRVSKKLYFDMVDVRLKNNLIDAKNDDECVVCYEKCKTKTECSHRVCKDCYYKLGNSCPCCRRDITTSPKITIDV